jgi:ribosomal protein S18 acetylase RimI-like enzyme
MAVTRMHGAAGPPAEADGIVIREMRPEDMDPLRWVIYRAYYEILLELYGAESATHYEVRSLDFMALYLRRDPAGSFVAETPDGGMAGSLFCFVWGQVGWFGSLAVAPEWQGRGLGQRLTIRAIDYLRSRGCIRIGLETWPTAPLTRHMYSKLGFEISRPTLKLSRSIGKDALANASHQDAPTPAHGRDHHAKPAGDAAPNGTATSHPHGWRTEWVRAAQPAALERALRPLTP